MRFPWGKRDDDDARALEDEIRAHLDMAAAERIGRGELPDQARDAARREFGNVGRVMELTREAWGAVWLDRLMQDLRYAVRSLRRAPVFSAVAIATLALGIGANTAMFTVVRGILLRPLPYPHPASLFAVEHIGKDAHSFLGPVMPSSEYDAFRRSTKAFSRLGAYATYPVTMVGAGDPVRVPAAGVTASLFPTVDVRPIVGRWFNDGEDGEQAAPVVIIANELWQSRFGGDVTVIGRSISIDGTRKTIVGVMPAGFEFPLHAQVWEPITISVSPGSIRLTRVVGRLAPRATLPQAMTELRAFALERESRTATREPTITAITPLRDAVVGDVGRSLWIFTAAVALVLLIACANVSNLLAMRARTRSHELAIRTAIGASRGRLMRQVLTESLVLSGLGGIAGLGVAYVGVALLLRSMPAGLLPRTGEIHVDFVVVAALLLGCVVTGALAGSTAAAIAMRQHPRQAMSDAVRATSRGAFRGVFVAAEVALALVLLVAAGLLVQSFSRLRGVDLGFRPTHIVAATLDFPVRQFPTADLVRDVEGRLEGRIAAIPGVTATAVINWLPLDSTYIRGDFVLQDGRKLPPGYSVLKPAVTPSYFAVMGVPIRQGRGFLASDVGGAARVAVVSESVAHRFWPGRSPIGERFSMSDHPTPADWVTIVGVAADVAQDGPSAPRAEAIYQSIAQMDQPFWINHLTFILRDTLPPGRVIPAIRQAVHQVDPAQPIGAVFPMDRRISDAIAEPRFRSTVLMVFSALALALATIGVYGVLAYAVTERTRELGIRIALGAAPGAVVRLVMRNAAAVAIPGLAIGLALSIVATRALSGFLYGVGPTDPATLLGASVTLLVVALLAGLVPALRASRIDPVMTIK